MEFTSLVAATGSAVLVGEADATCEIHSTFCISQDSCFCSQSNPTTHLSRHPVPPASPHCSVRPTQKRLLAVRDPIGTQPRSLRSTTALWARLCGGACARSSEQTSRARSEWPWRASCRGNHGWAVRCRMCPLVCPDPWKAVSSSNNRTCVARCLSLPASVGSRPSLPPSLPFPLLHSLTR